MIVPKGIDTFAKPGKGKGGIVLYRILVGVTLIRKVANMLLETFFKA